ncbi:hypothetical protein [Variovorax rhizosphaerae]|uniref:HK97 gp10 family phage protein n=1 Tax=Variovorax rhizosphaerae TaxID=1836200 RepID=A0ABU8WHK0_9BURK
MELKTFVAESLLQIVKGVVESSGEIAELGGAVSPVFHNREGTTRLLGSTKGSGEPVFSVDFDVALTTTTGSAKEAGEKLSVVAMASTSTKFDEHASEQTYSRIRFMVPLQLPADPVSRRAADEKAAQFASKSRRAM